MNGLLSEESLGKVKMIKGCAMMSKILNHFSNHKTKYIIGVLLIIVLSMCLYILSNQDNKIEKLSKSVLMLNIYNTKDELFATGSGFVAFENDVLVTNYHVIDKAYKIEAIDENDVVYSLDKVIAFDKEKDLAILKFSNPTDLKVLKLYDSSKISKGDEVIAIGSPLGLKNTVSKGIVSSIREDKETSIIQITAPISSGSSGGALLTENGKVIGVTFAGIEDGQNLNLAIPSNEVISLYKNKEAEQSVIDFFFEQNPNEKYKMDCLEVTFNQIYENPGKYHHKDICLKGYISSLSSNGGYLVESSFDITNNENYDFHKSFIERKYEDENRVIHFFNIDDYQKTINNDLCVGDFVAIYGNLFDTEFFLGENDWSREFGRPKVIEIIQKSSWNY